MSPRQRPSRQCKVAFLWCRASDTNQDWSLPSLQCKVAELLRRARDAGQRSRSGRPVGRLIALLQYVREERAPTLVLANFVHTSVAPGRLMGM